ncbi:MAG: Xaa-Pro peptidase family protein [Pseudomonadota bacterium]
MDNHKLLKLVDTAAKAGVDAVALVPGPNFRNLFGRDFHLMERPLVVIVPSTGSPVAIVPNLEMASFEEIGFPGQVFDWRDEDGYEAAFEAAADALPELRDAKRFGLEAQRMRAFEQMALARVFPQAALTDEHQLISSIRLIKADRDIVLLRKAISISEAALEATLAQVQIGQTEMEIRSILMRELFSHGAEELAFGPIVAAGDNSAQPHASSRSDYKIKAGDALLIDFGACFGGYNADITRTFFVREVSEYDRAFYETVQAANKRGKDAIRAGKTAHEIEDVVQKVLEESQFAEFKRHKTGHGLGLDVHEAPQIMRGNDAELKAGMVFTVEPGLYRIGECGVRIEDDVVVTETGMDCLTGFSRELRLVG